MRGLKAEDLAAIVDLIYNGEANIQQEDLDGFLELAGELQLKGLARAGKEKDVLKENIPETKNLKTMSLKTERSSQDSFEPAFSLENTTNWKNALGSTSEERSLVSLNQEVENLEDNIDSMIEEVNDGIVNRRCKV